MKNTICRTAIYIRVSTDQQAKEGDSIRDQLSSGERYINSHEEMILVGTYIDDGISGQKLDRDDFKRLLDDVQNDKIDLILFTRLDRWFRNLRHYLNTQEILDKHGVSWKAIDQPYDTSTASGRAFVNMSMIWAELETQNDSERILRVFEDKVKHGEVLSGSTPLGYSIQNKHLVPNSDAPKVRAIFEYYKSCGNLTSTIRWMQNELGIMREYNSLKKMLCNKKYIGEFRGNTSYCEPIIDRALFEEVQRLIPMNVKENTAREYVFSGLIKCSCCGHNMSGGQRHTSRKRKNGTKKVYLYSSYRCFTAINLHRCENHKSVSESALEGILLASVRQKLQQYILDCKLSAAPLRNVEKQKSIIQKKLNRLKDLYLDELINIDEYKIDRQTLIEKLEKLEHTESTPAPDFSHLEKLLAQDFESIYPTLEKAERRRFWRSIIKEIRIDEHKSVEIIFL